MNKDIGVQVATSNALFHQVLNCRRRIETKCYLNEYLEVNFPLRESFQAELRKNYGSEISIVPVDFINRPRTTLRRMNGFIAKNTNNLIKDMFKQPVSPDNKVRDFLSEITRRCEMKVVLSNALYFNGSWEYEFLFDPPYSGK